MITAVVISRRARRELKKIPVHIVIKLQDWIEDLEERGLEEVRKIPGYHDEPLQGRLSHLRSIRLSRNYRAYYLIMERACKFVSIERVDKHEY